MKDEPAFPTYHDPVGLTKREWFAGMAMQGCLSDTDFISAMKVIADKRGDISAMEVLAVTSLEIAGALIKELEKK